jgi:ribosomal protein S18 acetylase RimI-like enzyme
LGKRKAREILSLRGSGVQISPPAFMNSKITVKETDFDCAACVHSLIPEFDAKTKADFEKKTGGAKKLILVAEIEGEKAGYLVGYDRFRDGSFYVWMAGVVPAFRKNGVMTALMNHVEKWAKKNGFRKLKIKTRNRRREVLAFLVKNGFQFKKVFPRDDVSENRIGLEKNI